MVWEAPPSKDLRFSLEDRNEQDIGQEGHSGIRNSKIVSDAWESLHSS